MIRILLMCGCFLASSLCGCASDDQCNPSAAYVFRSPVSRIHESAPIQMRPTRSWAAPSYADPAAACVPAGS